MFFYLPSCTSALSVCLFVCIVYVFKKRNQRVCPTQHLVVYIIKINESVSDCLAPGPRKRENLLYPSGGAGGPAIPLPHPSRQSLFISFSPPHTKSFYISTFLHLKSSWSRCFFFAKIYYLGKVPTKCRPSGRCFGVHLFEIFREKIRYFENFDQWSKYCRCRMGDHEVRVFAHHCIGHN